MQTKENKKHFVFVFTIVDSPGPRSGKISVTSISGRDTALTGGQAGATLYTTTVLNQGPEDQLLLAREFLDRALQGMSAARSAVATTDGDSIADVSWIKVRIKSLCFLMLS